MYQVKDPEAFARWVRLVVDYAGGVSELVRGSFGKLNRQGVYEWLRMTDYPRLRAEISANAVEALVMASHEPLKWELGGYPATKSTMRFLDEPSVPRPVEFDPAIGPANSCDDVLIPTPDELQPLWAHHPDAFGAEGVSRLLRGKYPFDGKDAGERWPRRRWIAVDQLLLAALTSTYGRRMLSMSAQYGPTRFASAAAFVAWRWAVWPRVPSKRQRKVA